MAAVRRDRIGVPTGLHERRVLAWLRSCGTDSLAGRVVWCAAALSGGHAAGRRLRAMLHGDLEVAPLAVDAAEPPAELARQLDAMLAGVPSPRPLGAAARAACARGAELAEPALGERVRSGDVVVLHDSFTVSFAAALRDRGAHAIWHLRRRPGSRAPCVGAAVDFLDRAGGAAVDAVVIDERVGIDGPERVTALVPAAGLLDIRQVSPGGDAARAERLALSWISLLGEVVPEVWAQMEDTYRSVLQSGKPVLNLDLTRPRDGDSDRRNWLASYYPVRVKDEVVGVGVVVLDVTEREEAEDLRAAVMDNMVEGLYVLDTEGRLEFMNSAAERMLGWSGEELSGKSMHDAIHFQNADGSPHPEQRCELLKVRTEGRPVRMTHEAFTRKDGTILPVSYSAAPLKRDEEVHGVVVVFGDRSVEQAQEGEARRELDTLAWIGRIRDALDEDRLILYSQPVKPLAGGEPSEDCSCGWSARAARRSCREASCRSQSGMAWSARSTAG